MSITMKSRKAEIFAEYRNVATSSEIAERELAESQDEVRRLRARILELETKRPAVKTETVVRGNPDGPTNQARVWAQRLGTGAFVLGYDSNSGERRFWVKKAPGTPDLIGKRLSAAELEAALA